MASSKISALTALTSIASGDLIPLVDISDSSMAASGTTKYITRANLVSGLAASGANSDITSLSGLTTALSVAQGGTGAVTLTSGEFLVGAGTSAITSLGSSGSGNVVRVTSATLVTPILGVATATSINGLTITSSTGTLTLVNGSSLITSGANSVTLTSTGSTNVTLPTTGTLATLAGSETLSGKTLTEPKIADTGFIADGSGNEQIKFSTTSSAVNEITVKNAATGTGPELQATGGDTDIDLELSPKGTGGVLVNGTATSAAYIKLAEDTDNGTHYMAIKAPAAVTASTTLTLPDGAGTDGYLLKTNGSGTLSWIAPSTGSTALMAINGSAGSDNTTSATEDPVANASVSITPTDTATVQITVSGAFFNTNSANNYFKIKRTSGTPADIGFEMNIDTNASLLSTRRSFSLVAQESVAAGTHTYQVYFRTSAGTLYVENCAIGAISTK